MSKLPSSNLHSADMKFIKRKGWRVTVYSTLNGKTKIYQQDFIDKRIAQNVFNDEIAKY